MREGHLELSGGRTVRLLHNPSAQGLLYLVSRSVENRMRGLLLEKDVFWWDSIEATHGDIAAIYDPDFHDFARMIQYKKHRLELVLRENKIILYAGATPEELYQYPQTTRLLGKIGEIITTFNDFI